MLRSSVRRAGFMVLCEKDSTEAWEREEEEHFDIGSIFRLCGLSRGGLLRMLFLRFKSVDTFMSVQTTMG